MHYRSHSIDLTPGQVPAGYEDTRDNMKENPPSPLAYEKPKNSKKTKKSGQLLRVRQHCKRVLSKVPIRYRYISIW